MLLVTSPGSNDCGMTWTALILCFVVVVKENLSWLSQYRINDSFNFIWVSIMFMIGLGDENKRETYVNTSYANEEMSFMVTPLANKPKGLPATHTVNGVISADDFEISQNSQKETGITIPGNFLNKELYTQFVKQVAKEM
ncbi:hypothetical protein KY285_007928 [Solanum tuberosum]|nr:hypothetical protein KY285_007928 [Solanum tuberosum]